MGRVPARDSMAEAVVGIDAGPFEIVGDTSGAIKTGR